MTSLGLSISEIEVQKFSCPRRINFYQSNCNFRADVSPRMSYSIARQYHFYRNYKSSFGPEYKSNSYASDIFLNQVFFLFDKMR